jgi:hypothetical protein
LVRLPKAAIEQGAKPPPTPLNTAQRVGHTRKRVKRSDSSVHSCRSGFRIHGQRRAGYAFADGEQISGQQYKADRECPAADHAPAPRLFHSFNLTCVVQMRFQKIFQSSEKLTVATGVAIFIVFHFAALYLFDIV